MKIHSAVSELLHVDTRHGKANRHICANLTLLYLEKASPFFPDHTHSFISFFRPFETTSSHSNLFSIESVPA
jgi:hypothetical protein